MQWLRDFKIKTKLLSSFTIITLIMGAVGYVGISNIHKVAVNNETYSSAVNSIIILLTLCLLAAISVGVLTTLIIKRAIDKLLNFINDLKKGDYKNRIEITSNDEIGMIAKSMEQFAGQLHNLAVSLTKISDGDFNIEVRKRN